MEKERKASRHIDFEQNPPSVSGIMFVPNKKGEWNEVRLPSNKEEALEIEVEEGTCVDVYSGGAKFTFRVRYSEDGDEKETKWYDSSFSPLQKVNTKNKDAPFFWQVHKEFGLGQGAPPVSAAELWRRRGGRSLQLLHN